MSEDKPTRWNNSVEHPAEDELLCYIDGELSPKVTENLRSHLEACWQCRNRAEKFQSAISRFIDYRRQVMQPAIEAPNNWGGFRARLNEQAVEVVPPGLLQRFRNAISRMQFRVPAVEPRTFRLGSIAAMTVILAFAGLYYLIVSTPTVVSAEELIRLAVESRNKEIISTDQPVLYQQFRVRRKDAKGETVANVEVWQDVDNLRMRKVVASGGDGNVAAIADLEQILRANKYEPPPLSIIGFRDWRRTLVEKEDSVEQLQAEDGIATIRLRTDAPGVSSAGKIVSSTLVLRASDHHPIEQHFRVAGAYGRHEFEVRETSFAVMSLNSLNPGFFNDSVPMAVTAENLPKALEGNSNTTANTANANAAVAEKLPAVVATAELEVEVLNLLHGAKADLGEQIEVRRAPGGPVTVSGVVETPERKAEILSALQAVRDNPAVRINITTVSEALAAEKGNRAPRPQPSVENIEVEGDTFPAEPDVRQHFGDDAAVRSYASRMTSRSGRAMNYLWAMKRAKSQFSAAQLEKLSPEARAKWISVIRSYARSYQSEIGGLKRELQPVFGGGGGGGQGAAVGSDAELLRAIDQLFAAGSGVNQSVRMAMTTSSAGVNPLRSAQFWRMLANAEALAESIERAK